MGEKIPVNVQAREILAKYPDVVAAWEKSHEPLKRIYAKTIRAFAEGVTENI